MIITSRKNQIVQQFLLLKDKKYRDTNNMYLIEGEKTVKDAFRLNASVEQVLGVEELVKPYLDKTTVTTVTKDIADYVCDSVTPQGICAMVKKPQITKRQSDIVGLIDGVTDPGNIGTIIRTSSALGIKDLYLIDSADAFSPKAVRSSMSGIFSVNIHTGSFEDIYPQIKDLPIICADMGGESIFDFKPLDAYCLAVGNEAHGLSKKVREVAKTVVKLPMTNNMESLNVGVAYSVILYTMLKGNLVK